MKIVNLITQMEAGGAQGAAVRNARYQRTQGHQAEVWFLYRKRGVYDNEPYVKYFLSHKPNSAWQLLIILWKLFIELVKLNRSESALICYTHYANVIGGIVGRMAGVRRIVVSHRNPVDTYPKLCRKLDLVLGWAGVYNSAIAVSNTVLESFAGHPLRYRRRIKLIINGIDSNSLACAKEDAPDYIKKLFSDDVLYLCTTGRYHPQKNHVVLLEAMKSLTNAKLILAGDGELRTEYVRVIEKSGIEDRVVLLGEVPPHDVKYLLRYSDIFVFPSNYEAFGFSVVEAMAAKLPVICSDIPAMREIVGKNGILLDGLRAQDWIDEIVKLSSDHGLRGEYSDKSHVRSADFSLEKMAESYINECRSNNRTGKKQ